MPNIETEKKFLIRMPDADFLASLPGCEIWEILQTYLTSEPGCTRRVRRVKTCGAVRYFCTEKTAITGASAYEKEQEIPEEQYRMLLQEADPARRAIEKTRCRAGYAGHVLEFDLYPFWKKQAVLEIELSDESEAYSVPDWVKIIRDVTDDRAYKNAFLAKSIPEED